MIRLAVELGYVIGRTTKRGRTMIRHPGTGSVISVPVCLADYGKDVPNFKRLIARGAQVKL